MTQYSTILQMKSVIIWMMNQYLTYSLRLVYICFSAICKLPISPVSYYYTTFVRSSATFLKILSKIIVLNQNKGTLDNGFSWQCPKKKKNQSFFWGSVLFAGGGRKDLLIWILVPKVMLKTISGACRVIWTTLFT